MHYSAIFIAQSLLHSCGRLVRFRVNLLYMIPSAIHQLVNSKKIRPADFASVTSISCGAAYLPPQLVEGFKRAVKSAIEVTEGRQHHLASSQFHSLTAPLCRIWHVRSSESLISGLTLASV